MSQQPLVSVLIAAYNAAPYIGDCLASVVGQEYPNLEIVVVDDGSQDSTSKIIKQFDDPRITLLRQENQGHCAALNRAFTHSKGAFVKFLDADDCISKDMIVKQLARIQTQANTVAHAAWGRFYGDAIEQAAFKPESCWQDLTPPEWIYRSFVEGARMLQCGAWLFPREICLAAGEWNTALTLIDDYDYMLRAITQAELLLFTPEAKLYYRSNIPGSISSSFNAMAADSALRALELGEQTIRAVDNSERMQHAVANIYQSWAYTLYPAHPKQSFRAEQHAQRLGGSTEVPPMPKVFQSLLSCMPWRLVKRLYLLARSMYQCTHFIQVNRKADSKAEGLK